MSMTETNTRPVQEEARPESKIADNFRDARERVMQESAEIGEIYRSMTKPGFKDVYNAWVKNMDVVANSYSWGREKPGTRTRIVKVLNRVVGATAAVTTVPLDFIADTLSWLPRKVPFFGHFIPTHFLARHTVWMSGVAKNEALIARGVVKAVDLPGEVVGGAVKSVMSGIPEVRAAWEYGKRKAGAIAGSILHPKPKTI